MPNLADVKLEYLVNQHRDMLQVVKQMTAHMELDVTVPRTLCHLAGSLTGLFEPCAQLAIYTRSQELAWRTRGVFELSLIAAYICSSDTNRQRFEMDADLDELDIFERFTRKDARGANYQVVPKIEQRRCDLEFQKHARSTDRKKPMQAADFALAVNRMDEYQDVYEFYSKLAHPTAWAVLAGSKRPVSWDAVVRLLLLNANSHVAACLISLNPQMNKGEYNRAHAPA